jgi:glycosyltransferase involved in cell wall biosynthesis
MHKIKFSVVIPTCDRPRLLKEAVQSVISQSLPPDEIIIVGEIEDISDEVFKLDKKVRYARALPNIGVSQARNIGICQAGGDYIAFLDDDDTWDTNYLKEVSNVINKTGATAVLGGVKIMETGEIWQFRSDPINSLEHFKKDLLLTNPGTMGSNTVVERKLLLASSGFDPFLPTGEDRGIVFDLLSQPGAKVVRAEKAFMHYRTTTVKGPRLTDRDSLLKGKIRFFLKYWKEMDFSTRFLYFLNYLQLKDKEAAGIMRIWKWKKIIKRMGEIK